MQRSDRISCLEHISLVRSFRLILKGYYRTAEFAKKMAMQNLTCHRHSHKKSKSLVFLKIDTYFLLFEFLWIDYLRILIYLNPNLRLRLGLINKRNRLKGSCMNNTYLLFCSQTSGLTRWPHQQLSYKKMYGQINIY